MSDRFSVDAEHPEFTRGIERLYALINEQGGQLDPAITIQQRGGDISVFSAASAPDRRPIMQIPEHCLPDQNLFSVAIERNEIVIREVHRDCPALQRRVQERLLEIYNLAGKIPAQYRVNPRLAFSDDDELLGLLRRARPGRTGLGEPGDERTPEQHALRGLLLSRVLRQDHAGAGERPLLMPFIDLLNHHPLGASYRFTRNPQGGAVLSVASSTPVTGSRECFACYGRHYDALDLYLGYHYVAGNSPEPIVRSLPLRLDFGKFGAIDVAAETSGSFEGPLPEHAADLRYWVPRMERTGAAQLAVSQLLIPHAQAPLALRRSLGLLLATLAERELSLAESKDHILGAEQELLAQNESFYRELQAVAGAREPSDRNAPALEAVQRLAALQLGYLRDYRDRVDAL